MKIALDIETLEKPMPAGLLEKKEIELKESLSKQYKKPETIEAHLKEDLQTFKDRWKFSRQGARIICLGVGVLDEDNLTGCLDMQTWYGEDEAAIVRGFCQFIDNSWIDKIFTFNGEGFDLLHILRAMGQYRCTLVRPMKKYDFCDLMRYPWENKNGYLSLEAMAEMYGIMWPNEAFPVKDFENPDGSNVAAMWAADKADSGERVRNYCLRDVWVTAEIAHRVSGFYQF